MILYIIHLLHRNDRWQLLQNELATQKITDFRVWPGILDEEIPFRGVAKAHKQIVLYAKENNLPSILVAEDDVKFTAPGAMSYFLEQEPLLYDLYLGGISHGKIGNDQTVTDFAGTMLYKINQYFYDTFLSIPEDGHIDRNLKNKGRYIVCQPFAATQHNGYSDNKKEYFNYDLYLNGRTLFGH